MMTLLIFQPVLYENRSGLKNKIDKVGALNKHFLSPDMLSGVVKRKTLLAEH